MSHTPLAVGDLDMSMFTPDDLRNLVLQRSDVLTGMHRPGKIIQAWMAGDSGPIDQAVETLGDQITRRAALSIQAEFDTVIDHVAPAGRVADIGCGYAMFDLFAAHRFEAELVLIDLEVNEQRHFGYQADGAAYSNLATARAFLEANGVPAASIETLNPDAMDVTSVAPVDLAVSFISCGFHYPVSTYMPFFKACVRPGGQIVLDLRSGRSAGQMRDLETLGPVQVIDELPKVLRVLVTKEEGLG